MGGEDSGTTYHDARDEDDEDDYEDTNGGNRLLGFMFGNVDDSGDLDVDYLDEDAKEHLSALADKLGPSLSEIDLSTKSPETPADASVQDYDEKAEDAVDYEDIEEQYEGPEIEATTEEDHLLSKKEYFSAKISLDNLEKTVSVFDEENYDEDEDFGKEQKIMDNNSEVQTISSPGEQGEHLGATLEGGKSPEVNLPFHESLETESPVVDSTDLPEGKPEVLQVPFNCKVESLETSLPILCIEDGVAILRFSEIFGVREPSKKREKRNRRYPIPRERYKAMNICDIVEEDEEAFLKGSTQGFYAMKHAHVTQDDNSLAVDSDNIAETFGTYQGIGRTPTLVDDQRKDSCLSAEPMKDGVTVDLSEGWRSPSCPQFYPLEQKDWEEEIIWGNSPTGSSGSLESCVISQPETGVPTGTETESEFGPKKIRSEPRTEPDENDHSLFLHGCPVLVEPLGSRTSTDSTNLSFPERNFHPQLLRLESRLETNSSNYSELRKENASEELFQSEVIRRFRKLSMYNMDMLEGSWLDKIIWEPDKFVSKPKLILDLQDKQMLFEISDSKDNRHLCFHAGAMIVTSSMKSNGGDSFDLPGQGGVSVGRFNISNDKYYSNRKTSQLKSHSKKRAAHGVKVFHSIPALKLQTMRPKLSNKDIANFHRPKALWYPHDNEVVAKEQGKLSTHGPMKVILKSLGGKGSKLHVDVEETIASVKAKASKKLDFKPSENVKIFYSGKELEDIKSLAAQNVRPNSLLHLVRTKIQLWPRAQKLPGENMSLRPPGAFKKKSDLSVKDGHVFLMEYCEERPLILGNVGMGARLCTYHQKSAPDDQTASLLRNGSRILGSVLTLDPADKSPFLGDLKPGCSQSSLETNMYRAPIFSHKVPSTDYLLVRSPKGKLSLRRIDRIDVVGQQEPHMEVISPGSKGLQTYIVNRLLVHVYREFRATDKHGYIPCIRADELSAQFSNLSESFIRKRLKHCADLQRVSNGQVFWFMRRNFRIPLEEELRRLVTPENVCAYESMQAGLYRLKRLGISKLTHPTGLASAMNQLPDEAIALAAASHIERELQITPWNLSSNFVACTNQDRENIERLEITGVGDPSGRGLGFSYVRIAPKAPISSAMLKKKTAATRGGSTVTGTDADLRRLSMEAAREVLLKFNVPEEQIAKQTRWHRIAMIRKLSSEQAASGVKVDPTTISKYARGQRMSFLQLQQQTREKCQEIWDRQVQSLSAVDGDENESDSEANSDLDSFAGDLENLLDAEECEEGEEGNNESKRERADGVRGLKMRRHPIQAQAEEEIEDEAAEAAELCRMLMDDDEAERRKKKARPFGQEGMLSLGSKLGFGSESAERTKKTTTVVRQIIRDGSLTSKEQIIRDPKEVESFLAKRNFSGKVKEKTINGKKDIAHVGILKKKAKAMGDGIKAIKEKKPDKPTRESFVCGACGQLGHMRTNKNCPRYGEDLEMQIESNDLQKASAKPSSIEISSQPQQKTSIKKLIAKTATKIAVVEAPEAEKFESKAKILPLKLKCGPAEKIPEKIGASQSSDKQVVSDAETGNKSSAKINRIIISNKTKSEDAPTESHKPSIVIRPPIETERERHRKKIIIKQPKEIVTVDQVKQEVSIRVEEYRKTKKMVELSSFEKHKKQENKQLAKDAARRKAIEERRWWEEEEKRRNAEMMKEERARRRYEEERRMQAEEQRLAEIRRYENARQQEGQKAKKKKKKKRPEIRDEFVEEQRATRNDRRIPERDRAAKRRPVVDLGKYGAEYVPQAKRRKGGEVGLANVLENIVDTLRDKYDVSYLFLKPVSKKEAPDYLDIIKRPMDLSTIREKVRRMDYKSREDFRHDVWQITYNAHRYNDGRNPSIPPLADQLLELCDYLIGEYETQLTEAESGIEYRDI